MFQETMNLTGSLIPPNVSTFCYYGVNVSTPRQFIYTKNDLSDSEPKIVYGDGDGTVNIGSLMACKQWEYQMSYNITVKEYPGVEHTPTVKNPLVISDIDNIVCNLK